MRVSFSCAERTLEGEMVIPAACTSGAVVCHPHPQYGGDMENAVVRELYSTFESAGFAALRFNFRGVGRSTGQYGGGVGEVEDTHAAVRYLRECSGVNRFIVAGYSFGAMVALHVGTEMAEVEQVIAVAPPLAFLDLDFLAGCATTKLFIVGSDDQYCPLNRLREQLERVPDPKGSRIITGADHFFFGYEKAVGDAVWRTVARTIS